MYGGGGGHRRDSDGEGVLLSYDAVPSGSGSVAGRAADRGSPAAAAAAGAGAGVVGGLLYSAAARLRWLLLQGVFGVYGGSLWRREAAARARLD